MPYTPTFNTFDPRAFVENLLTAIEDQQEEALAWVAGEDEPLPNIAKFYNSAAGRLTTVFPVLMVTNHSAAQKTEDTLEVAMSVDFELMISGGNPDILTSKALDYSYMLTSILQNTRPKSLSTTAVAFNGYLDTLETEFSVLRGLNGSSSSFLQIVQYRAIWILTASAFTSAN
jgi:hypothetical protein